MPPAETPASGAEGVLWLFGAVALITLVFAAQVAFGYSREARIARRAEPDPRRFRLALAAAAAALGSGLWAAMVLGLASEPLGHSIGYRPLGLGLVWLAAVALGGVVLAPPARHPSRLATLGGGVLFGSGIPLLWASSGASPKPCSPRWSARSAQRPRCASYFGAKAGTAATATCCAGLPPSFWASRSRSLRA